MASNIFMYELITDNNNIASEIYERIKSLPDDDLSYFEVDIINDNEINGRYVIVQNVEEVYYNSENRNFETRTILKAAVVYFDVYNNILEIWSNKTNANKLIFTLSNILNGQTINAIDISLIDIIKKLQNKGAKVSKVRFEDFLFTEDIVGSFSVDLSSYGDAYSVLNKYKDKISKITMILPCVNETIKLCLTQKGKVIVYKKREQLDEDTISLLNEILLK